MTGALWEKGKAAAVVVFITLLIWFVADQNVTQEQDFTINVRVVSAQPDHYAAFAAPPYERSFTFTLSERRRLLSELAKALGPARVFDAVIPPDEKPDVDPQHMRSKEILGYVQELRAFGLSRADSVDPQAVRVRIDEFVSVPDVRVRPVYGDLRVTAQHVPDQVTVQVPGFCAALLRANPVATADAEQAIGASVGPDGGFEVTVPLAFPALADLPPDARPRVLPDDAVLIKGRIESLTATRRVGPIVITWSIPDEVQRRFVIVPAEGTDFRPDIDVTGPRDRIDRLDPRDIRAFVEVLAADTEKPGVKLRRKVQFVLPTGFSMAADSPTYEIEFEVRAATTDALPSAK